MNGQKPNDAREALHWYTLAAQSGNAEAQSVPRRMFRFGCLWILKGDSKACISSAKQGHARGLCAFVGVVLAKPVATHKHQERELLEQAEDELLGDS